MEKMNLWETTANVMTIALAVCVICIVIVLCVGIIVEMFKIADKQIHQGIMEEIGESVNATKKLYETLREADEKKEKTDE
jgi:uncharacterized protein YneF (UPF0154 family)